MPIWFEKLVSDKGHIYNGVVYAHYPSNVLPLRAFNSTSITHVKEYKIVDAAMFYNTNTFKHLFQIVQKINECDWITMNVIE